MVSPDTGCRERCRKEEHQEGTGGLVVVARAGGEPS